MAAGTTPDNAGTPARGIRPSAQPASWDARSSPETGTVGLNSNASIGKASRIRPFVRSSIVWHREMFAPGRGRRCDRDGRLNLSWNGCGIGQQMGLRLRPLWRPSSQRALDGVR